MGTVVVQSIDDGISGLFCWPSAELEILSVFLEDGSKFKGRDVKIFGSNR